MRYLTPEIAMIDLLRDEVLCGSIAGIGGTVDGFDIDWDDYDFNME